MSESRKMHMVADTIYDETGLNVAYGAGELHEPGSLPEGVRYTEVLADDAQVAGAPAHAQAEDPAAEEAGKQAEFEKIQTETSPGLPAAPPAAAAADAKAVPDSRAGAKSAPKQESKSSGPQGPVAGPPSNQSQNN